MRTTSGGARYYLFGLGLAGVLVYLLIVDLGIAAGRIHPGVSVGGVDVGGLTQAEAADLLERRARLLRSQPLVFRAPGLYDFLEPQDVGWDPNVHRRARAALRVGRTGAPFGAMVERWRAWFGGVRLLWFGKPSPAKIDAYIDGIEQRAEALGYELDRVKFRRKIRRGITTWPRRPLRVPVSAPQG